MARRIDGGADSGPGLKPVSSDPDRQKRWLMVREAFEIVMFFVGMTCLAILAIAVGV